MSQESGDLEISIGFTDIFLKQVKKLEKKYPHINDDVKPIADSLLLGNLLGDRLSGVDAEVYKVRVKNTDIRKGKSGGYRLIYYVVVKSRIIFMTIYAKSEQDDIEASEIKEIIQSCE
jgi:mRNA-degrading endonuclease RelE of RelBE toxin-antitoxin system